MRKAVSRRSRVVVLNRLAISRTHLVPDSSMILATSCWLQTRRAFGRRKPNRSASLQHACRKDPPGGGQRLPNVNLACDLHEYPYLLQSFAQIPP
jgi:hypothetical protein